MSQEGNSTRSERENGDEEGEEEMDRKTRTLGTAEFKEEMTSVEEKQAELITSRFAQIPYDSIAQTYHQSQVGSKGGDKIWGKRGVTENRN